MLTSMHDRETAAALIERHVARKQWYYFSCTRIKFNHVREQLMVVQSCEGATDGSSVM